MTHINQCYVYYSHAHTETAAMAGQDYTSIINMPIILRPGMQTIQITVNLIDDQLIEINEVFRGTLSLVTTDRVSLGLDNADATIIEDESIYMYTLCRLL